MKGILAVQGGFLPQAYVTGEVDMPKCAPISWTGQKRTSAMALAALASLVPLFMLVSNI